MWVIEVVSGVIWVVLLVVVVVGWVLFWLWLGLDYEVFLGFGGRLVGFSWAFEGV